MSQQFARPQPPIQIECFDPIIHVAPDYRCWSLECPCWHEQQETSIDLSAAFQRDPGLLSRHHHLFEGKRITAHLVDPTPTQPLVDHPQQLPIIGDWLFDTQPEMEQQEQQRQDIDSWVERLKRFIGGK